MATFHGVLYQVCIIFIIIIIIISLFSEVMLTLRFPRTLHSYNGTEFKSKLFEHLTQQLETKKPYIST